MAGFEDSSTVEKRDISRISQSATQAERGSSIHHSRQARRSASRKRKSTGTQASGFKDVGCQATVVPLPPLGFDPMLYYGSPAAMGAGFGIYSGRGMPYQPHPMMQSHPMMNMPIMGGGFYGHPIRSAWGGGSNERIVHAPASSPGSSAAPNAHPGSDTNKAESTTSSQEPSASANTDS